MNKKLFIIIYTFFTIISAGVSYASETGYVYFYTENEYLFYDVRPVELIFNGYFTTEEKAIILYENLFEKPSGELKTLVPPYTKIYKAQFIDGHLKINVSSEIKNYGGSTWEEFLVYQLVITAFSLDEVEELSIFIEGWADYLPEGTYIQNIKRSLAEDKK